MFRFTFRPKRGSIDLFRNRFYKHFAPDGAKIGLRVSMHRGAVLVTAN